MPILNKLSFFLYLSEKMILNKLITFENEKKYLILFLSIITLISFIESKKKKKKKKKSKF